MKRKFRFTRRALNDLSAAQEWYHLRDPKLADLLLIDVHAIATEILQHPQRFREIAPGTRAVRCRRFPYRIYYEIFEGVVVIKSVYHTSRDPRRWNDPDRD
jgi:toxin ParE1/3/4